MKLKKITELAEKEAAEWNSKYPVGQKVKVERDDGSIAITKTTFRATVIATSAVGWFADIRGAYLLDRVTPIEE